MRLRLPPPYLFPIAQTAAPRRTPLSVQNFRVVNVEIPNGKRIEISLQYIYGIGSTTAKAILRDTVGLELRGSWDGWTMLHGDRHGPAWHRFRPYNALLADAGH